MPSRPGVLISGRYLLLETVGKGGFGRVWRGHDQLLDREVAVKEVLLPPNLPKAERDELLTRTLREARAAARLSHPSVITIHDVAEHDGVPWIVMEFVSGPTLRGEIERYGRLPWQRCAEIGEQVAEGLSQAHAAGVVHRDLKPDNIMLTGRRAIVTDFGIARIADATTKLTGTGVIMGTPSYMAPEQFDERPVGPATDMWAFGATLYAAVEGRTPFEGTSLSSLIGAVLTRSPDYPAHAGPLTALILALLAKDPALRPDAATVARSLAAYRAGPAPARPPAVPWPLPTSGHERVATGQPRRDSLALGLKTQPPAPLATPTAGNVATQGKSRRPHRSRTLAVAAIGVAVVIAAVIVVPRALGGHSTPTVTPSGAASLVGTFADPGSMGVQSLAFSPDGKTLAAGDDNGSAYVWDIGTGKISGTFTDPNGDAVSGDLVAFSPDGTTLAVGAGHGTGTYLWNTGTGKVTETLTDPGSQGVFSVAFSPGNLLAASDDNGHTYLWDTGTRKITETLTDPGNDTIHTLAFSPKGDGLAISTTALTSQCECSSDTYLWNTGTEKIAETLTDPRSSSEVANADSLAFSPVGHTLATGDNNGSTYLWNTDAGQITATLTNPSSKGVQSLAFSPDGKILAAGDNNGHTYLWDISTGSIIATITDPGSKYVLSVAFSPDGKNLATSDNNGSTYVWHITGT